MIEFGLNDLIKVFLSKIDQDLENIFSAYNANKLKKRGFRFDFRKALANNWKEALNSDWS